MVYGRQVAGKPTTFGTSGYTYADTFVLYDRATESLWYPMGDGKFTAISGKLKGATIPYIKEPPIMTLGEWRKLHPQTRVLIGDRSDLKGDTPSVTAPDSDENSGQPSTLKENG